MELALLQRRVSQLEMELQEKDQDLVTAAQLGNKLLGSNQELQNRLEELTKEYSDKIESLEQVKYSLQQKLDREQSNCHSVQQEMETLRNQMEEEHKWKAQRVEEVCAKRVHDATSLNEDLKMEVQKLEVQVKNYQEKLRKQEDMLEQLNEDAGDKGNTTVLQHELRDLESVCAHAKATNEELEMRILDVEASNELLQVENSSLSNRVESLDEECEERSKNANAWFEALQEAKVQIFELNGQLERVKMDTLGELQGNGNSLFGEVDDRRQDVERKLITLRVKYETMEKSHSTTKHHFKKLKAEMSALLCQYGATTADAAHVQRLQRALEQSRSETQALLTKLHKMEKQQADVVSGYERQRCLSAFTDFGDKKEYIQFLERELEQTRAEKARTLRELDMKRTQLLWETNKLSDTEARLHHSEQERAKVKKEITKLRLRLQETTEKLTETQAACKLLEEEKKLLEEQIKSRGRRGADQARRRSQAVSRDSSIQGTSHSLQVSVLGGDSKVKPQEEGGETLKENTAPAPQPQKKKEINLLEELEREFSEPKQEQPRNGGQRNLTSREVEVSSLEKGSWTSSRKEAADISRSNISTESSPHRQRSTAPAVTRRVIHVNSTSPNECPQQ